MITHISPLGSMDMLSQLEVDMLKRTASSDLYQLFRNCSLAVLNSGSLTDNSKELLSRFENFDINVLRRERGVKLELINPPEEAFVDGRIIRALQANLFAVLRDILFVYGQIHNTVRFPNLNLDNSVHITNLVFSICVTLARCMWVKRQRWWSAGAVTQLTKTSICMPVASGTAGPA
ncbi:hypothetical protein GCM10029976_000340 [Kribbella albertanoniae]